MTKKLIGAIIESELRAIRNTRDRAGDIADSEDFKKLGLDGITEGIGAPLTPEKLKFFLDSRGLQINDFDIEFLIS